MGKICDLTPRKLTKVEILSKEGFSGCDVARKVGISTPSVSRTKKKLNTGHTLSPKRPGKCGRPKKTSSRTNTFLVRE